MIKIILFLALALRLIGINQSWWLDEAISVNVAKMSIIEIINKNSIVDFHPPLHYWFLNLWIKVFGDSVIALRLSSVLFSLITIYFVYLIGKKIKNRKIGNLASLFLAINPLFLYYSQELRMYSMATMWLTIGGYYFLKIKNREYKTKDLILFNVMMALSFGTFYGSIFMMATFAIYFLIKKKWRLFFLTNIGTGLIILLLSPLLWIQLKNSKIMLAEVTNWKLVLGKVNLKNLLLIPIKFSTGRVNFYPKIRYYLIGGSWSLFIFIMILKTKKKYLWLTILLIIPILLAVLFSIKTPLLEYFRFLYLIPIVALILALSSNKKWEKILIIGGFLIFSLIYLLNPSYHREDWKSVANELKNEKSVYMIGTFSDPIKYYNPQLEIKDLKTKIPIEKNIWVIPYGEAVHGINSEEKLKKLGYKRTWQKDFREMELEKWEK